MLKQRLVRALGFKLDPVHSSLQGAPCSAAAAVAAAPCNLSQPEQTPMAPGPHRRHDLLLSVVNHPTCAQPGCTSTDKQSPVEQLTNAERKLNEPGIDGRQKLLR